MSAADALRVLCVGLALGALLTPPVVGWLRRRGTLDVPNARSSHSSPVPRGAGIALMTATVFAAVAGGSFDRTFWVVVVAATGYGLVGVAEDLRGLSAGLRLALQAGTALVAAVLIERGGGSWPTQLFEVLAVTAVVTSVCNAVNFMDGINGISAAQSIGSGAFLALLGAGEHIALLEVGGLALVGAALAFLPFNAPQARVFLGDGGSYFIGGWLALLVGAAFVTGTEPVVLAAPFVVYLADTSVTLVRRALRGAPLLQSHREHAYQRLVASGWSHVQTSLLVFALVVLHGLVALVVRDASTTEQVAGVAVVACTTLTYLLLPRVVERPRNRRPAAAGAAAWSAAGAPRRWS